MSHNIVLGLNLGGRLDVEGSGFVDDEVGIETTTGDFEILDRCCFSCQSVLLDI